MNKLLADEYFELVSTPDPVGDPHLLREGELGDALRKVDTDLADDIHWAGVVERGRRGKKEYDGVP